MNAGVVRYWVSNRVWTAQVNVRAGIVIKAPPILHRFRGKHFREVLQWSISLGGHEMQELRAEELRVEQHDQLN